MIKENIALKSFKFLGRDLVGDILYWPVWWYTKGIKKAVKRFFSSIAKGNQIFGLTIWTKNLFRPMYGQNDWQGQLISFFIRLVQIIFRAIALFFWIIFSLIIFLFWIILPIIIVLEILYNTGLLNLTLNT